MSTTLSKILPQVLDLKTKFFIDIGASNSLETSESERLIQNGWSGIMFEWDQQKAQGLRQRVEYSNITIHNSKVTPDNILPLMRASNVQDGFYMSIDIDGYDYFVLDKILSEYKPGIIVTECNSLIPPGIKFAIKYHPDYFWDTSYYQGYSISMIVDLLEKYNYKIQNLDMCNLVLVPGKQEEDIEKIWNDGYFSLPRPKHHLGFEFIYSLTKEEQYNWIKENFSRKCMEPEFYMEFPYYSWPGYQVDNKPVLKKDFILEMVP
jgi:hypothetical protein